MNIRSVVLTVVAMAGISCLGLAQDSSAIKRPAWNVGVFAGGGTRVTDRPSVGILNAGVRVGRVLTGEHGAGLLRGTFEYDAEVMPVYTFFSQGQTFYGAAVTPLLVKWNFTSGRKVLPFFEAGGSAIFTAKNFPAGDTSTVNFGTGAGVGANVFVRPKRAITFDARAVHISNASLGNHNPGVNAALVFTLGYSWFK